MPADRPTTRGAKRSSIDFIIIYVLLSTVTTCKMRDEAELVVFSSSTRGVVTESSKQEPSVASPQNPFERAVVELGFSL